MNSKNCPFCNQHNFEIWAKTTMAETAQGASVYVGWIECRTCGACGPLVYGDISKLRETMIEAWNTRYD